MLIMDRKIRILLSKVGLDKSAKNHPTIVKYINI